MTKKYESGQVWSYDNRVNEPDSKLVLLKIEELHNEEIFHVHVFNLNLTDPGDIDAPLDCIFHMPFSKKAFEKSIRNLEGVTEVPDFKEGYDVWREAYDNGEGGVYSITVGEAVSYMESTINDGSPQYDG